MNNENYFVGGDTIDKHHLTMENSKLLSDNLNLRQQLASRDAEIADLKAWNRELVKHQDALADMCDQLRKDVTLLRDELKYIGRCISNRPVIQERIRAVLAATEPKP